MNKDSSEKFDREYFSNYAKQKKEICDLLIGDASTPRAVIVVAENGLGTGELIEDHLYPEEPYKMKVINDIDSLECVKTAENEIAIINENKERRNSSKRNSKYTIAASILSVFTIILDFIIDKGFLNNLITSEKARIYVIDSLGLLFELLFFFIVFIAIKWLTSSFWTRRKTKKLIKKYFVNDINKESEKEIINSEEIDLKTIDVIKSSAVAIYIDNLSKDKEFTIYIKSIKPNLFFEISKYICCSKIISVAYYERSETTADLYYKRIIEHYDDFKSNNTIVGCFFQPPLNPDQIEDTMQRLGVLNPRALTLLRTSHSKYEALKYNFSEYINEINMGSKNSSPSNFELFNVNILGKTWLDEWVMQDQLSEERNLWKVAVLLSQMLVVLVGRCDIVSLREYVYNKVGCTPPKNKSLRDEIKGSPHIYLTKGGSQYRVQEYVRPHYLKAKSEIPYEHNELLYDEPYNFLNYIVKNHVSKYKKLKEQVFHKTTADNLLPILKSLSNGFLRDDNRLSITEELHEKVDYTSFIIGEILSYGAIAFHNLYQRGERKAAILACDLALCSFPLSGGEEEEENDIESIYWYNLKAAIHTVPGRYEDAAQALFWANKAREIFKNVNPQKLDYKKQRSFVTICSTLVESFIMGDGRDERDALLARTFIQFSLEKTEQFLCENEYDEILLSAYLNQLMTLYKASSSVHHYGSIFDDAYINLNSYGISQKNIHKFKNNLDLSISLLIFFGRRLNKSAYKKTVENYLPSYIGLVDFASDLQKEYPQSSRCLYTLWWVHKSMAFHCKRDSESLLDSMELHLNFYEKKRSLVGAHHQISPQLIFYIFDRIKDAVEIELKVKSESVTNSDFIVRTIAPFNISRIDGLYKKYFPILTEHLKDKLYGETTIKELDSDIEKIESFLTKDELLTGESKANMEPIIPLSQMSRLRRIRKTLKPEKNKESKIASSNKELIRVRFFRKRINFSFKLWACNPEINKELYFLDVINLLANGFGKPNGSSRLQDSQLELLNAKKNIQLADMYPALQSIVPRKGKLTTGDLLVGKIIGFNHLGFVFMSGKRHKILVPCIRPQLATSSSNVHPCILASPLLEGVVINSERHGLDLSAYCRNEHYHLMQIIACQHETSGGFEKEVFRIKESSMSFLGLGEQEIEESLSGIDYIATMRGENFVENVVTSMFAPFKMVRPIFSKNMMLTGSKSIMVCRLNDRFHPFYIQKHVSLSIRSALGLTKCIFIRSDATDESNIRIIEKVLQTPLRRDEDGNLVIYADEVGKKMRHAQIAKNIMKKFSGNNIVRTAKPEEIDFDEYY
ncbi:hypothetical protein ACRRS0_16665 [Agarivorans sp. QJM3NY_29]|uniref:hypothetical protein n=1 Tax=unclassified Agarivorans TaxID=2636026 RepID=UPI003D7C99FE